MDGKPDNKRKYFDIAPPSSNPPATSSIQPQNRPMLGHIDNSAAPSQSPIDDLGVNEPTQQDTLMDPDEAGDLSKENLLNHNASEAEKVVSVADGNLNRTIPPETIENADIPAVNPLPSTNTKDTIVATENEAEKGTITATTISSEKVINPLPTTKPAQSDELPKDMSKPSNLSDTPKENDTDMLSAKEDTTLLHERFTVTDSMPDPGEQVAKTAQDNMQNPKIYDTKEYYVPIGDTHHTHGNLKGALIFGMICAIIVIGAVIYLMFRVGK